MTQVDRAKKKAEIKGSTSTSVGWNRPKLSKKHRKGKKKAKEVVRRASRRLGKAVVREEA